MDRFDVNCFCGQWPFHSSRYSTLESLRENHNKVEIHGGAVTSLQTVFYLDPLTDAAELAQNLPEGYHQICAINPKLTDAQGICREAVERYGVSGFRLVPTFHDFDWNGKEVRGVLEVCEEKMLPIFITWNLEDPRLDYLLQQKPLDGTVLSSVIRDLPDVPIVITNAYLKNINSIASAVCSRDRVFVETSSLNAPLLALDMAYEQLGSNHLLFGTGHHIQAVSSSVQNMLHCDIPQNELEDIWYGNAARIFPG